MREGSHSLFYVIAYLNITITIIINLKQGIMKVKNFFMMAAVGFMAVVSLGSCDDILGEWDKPAGLGVVAPQNPQTTTTITLNLDGNLFNNDKLYLLSGDAAINIATITEGAPVTITSSDENVITIDADGNVVPVGPGTATITIKVTENEKYTGATETITIVVGRKVAINEETGAEFVAQNGDQITGTAPNTMHVTIPDGVLVRLKDATIKPTTGDATAAIVCAGDATLVLEGVNVVTGNGNQKAGLQVGPEGKTLTIDGTGSMTVRNYEGEETTSYWGAAIGSCYQGSCGNIIIKNGVITAIANSNSVLYNHYGAGIGSGREGSCQSITISGGNVTARGGIGCAIGTGYMGTCQDILISSGVVDAEVILKNQYSHCGTAIGAAFGGQCGNITINDGEVSAISTMTDGPYYCSAAGIGTTGKSSCGIITISGGTVVAKCSKKGTGASESYQNFGGPGIGAGDASDYSYTSSCGDIIITGGDVTAAGGLLSPGIGVGKTERGHNNCSSISITGGIVNAIGDDGVDDIGEGYNHTNYTIGTITVDVTWNGTKGYTATATGYNKVH